MAHFLFETARKTSERNTVPVDKPWTNRGLRAVERPIRAVDATAPESAFVLPKRPRVRSLFKIVAAAFVKIQYSKILGVPGVPIFGHCEFCAY